MSKQFDINLMIGDNKIQCSEQQIEEFRHSEIYSDLIRLFRRELAMKIKNLITEAKQHEDVIADQTEAAIYMDYQDGGLIEALLACKVQDKQQEEDYE